MRPALAVALTAVTAGAAPRPASVTPGERAAAESIRVEQLRAHIRFLAGDVLEGRGPGTRGDRLAQAYIAAQMERIGMEPAGPGGSFFQTFELVGITSHIPETIVLAGASQRLELRTFQDFIAFAGQPSAESRVDGAEVVFVGYGIVAPEYEWDDYKGVDLHGKVVLVMNNDPEDDPSLFAGRTRLHYGRWDYKYEAAARAGAAGAIIIHTDSSAGYRWQVVQTSWSGEQFTLPDEGGTHLQVKAWATEDACRRIVRLAGRDLDALRAAAQKRDFRPVPLGVTVSIALKNEVARKQTANVLGRLPGSDPVTGREAVVYTAHHDHLGMKPGARPGEDAIYNGAVDNASGVATLLAIAEAMTRLPQRPRRSVLFAAVAAEEPGLLGSRYLALHPPLPAGNMAVDVNIDGVSIFGRTRDLAVIGLGKSSVDDDLRALAAMQGRMVVGDPFPDKGFFYRSDQLSLARVGVPAAYVHAGTDVVGKPPGWGNQQQQRYETSDYHQPSDELRTDWDLSGAVEDAQLLFFLGVKVANAARMPVWKPGDEFEAARKKARAETGASK
jgi:Zn-dependent M28 family amino/carboxypeptidase